MVEKSEAPKEDLTRFNPERYISQLQAIGKDPENIDIDTWVAMLYESTNMFKMMGSAMSAAFSDITSKAAAINDNKQHFAKNMNEEITVLQRFIEKEKELDLQKYNGKTKPKDKKGSWEYNYVSTSRTVLRNLWFMDYMSQLFQRLNANEQASLGTIAKEAYEASLATHHIWIVK